MRRLKLIKVLDYYDVPEIFVAVDVMNTKYICLRNSYCQERGYIYISIQISDDRYDDYLNQRIDLRGIFLNPEMDNCLYEVSVQREEINAIPILQIEDSSLPDEGYFYEEDEYTDNIDLLTETQQKGHTIFRLGFVDNHNSHEIDTECLAQAISSFQKTVTHCHQKLFGKQKTIEAKLNVTTFRAASFDVEFRTFSPVSLFGNSDICETFNKIDQLMTTSNDEELKAIVLELSGRTISSYRSFINIMRENNLAIKYKWVSSIADSEVVSSRISTERIENIHNLLKSSRELEAEYNEYDGIFLASSVENGKWTLKANNPEEKNISGISEDKSILSGIIIEQQRYHIKCREIIEQNIATLKTENKVVLLEIQEI